GHALLDVEGRAGAGFGSCAQGVDDVDGDGVPELLVGSWLDPSAGPRAGRVQLLSGRDGAPLLALAGDAGETFGFAAAALGDVDGDGRLDVAIASACRGGDAGPATGRVSVLSLALGLERALTPGEAR
ncbi:MAG: FG-GAP repeat protein, partial [Planctomycetes bacterium]|nr:FG-GAP repeat protein [Planctomycetota bacterium]